MPKYVGRIEKDIWGNDRIVARREASAEDYIGTGIDIGVGLFRAANAYQKDKLEQAEARRAHLAIQAAMNGRMQEATARINALIDRIEGDENLYWFRAQIYYLCAEKWYRQDKPLESDSCRQAAIADCNTAVKIGGPDPIVIWLRALCYLELGSLAYAASDVTFCVRAEPQDVSYLQAHSDVFHCLGDEKQALWSIEQAIRLDPDPAKYSLRGRIYLSLRNYAKAIEDLDRAIYLGNGDPYDYESRQKAYDALMKDEGNDSQPLPVPPPPREQVGPAPIYQRSANPPQKRYRRWESYPKRAGLNWCAYLSAWLGVGIPLIGLPLGVLGLKQILASEGEEHGYGCAAIGIIAGAIWIIVVLVNIVNHNH